jgi:hypothetical protein
MRRLMWEVAIPTRSQPDALDFHPGVYTIEREMPKRDMLQCHDEN